MDLTKIAIPGVRLTGKRKGRSQICEVLTDDGRWLDKELPALYGCVDDEGAGLAFILDAANQYLAEDGYWHQLISEKSQVPICLRETSQYQNGVEDEKQLAELASNIFVVSAERAQAEEFSKADMDDKMDKMLWIVCIVCGTLALFGAMAFFGGGG